MGRVVGVNGLRLRFFVNGLSNLGSKSETLDGFILVAWNIVVKRVGNARGLIKTDNVSETTSNGFAYNEQIHVKKKDGPTIS